MLPPLADPAIERRKIRRIEWLCRSIAGRYSWFAMIPFVTGRDHRWRAPRRSRSSSSGKRRDFFEKHTGTRQLRKAWGVFFRDQIRAHPVPDHDHDVFRFAAIVRSAPRRRSGTRRSAAKASRRPRHLAQKFARLRRKFESAVVTILCHARRRMSDLSESAGPISFPGRAPVEIEPRIPAGAGRRTRRARGIAHVGSPRGRG